jgi:hypothetical protein
VIVGAGFGGLFGGPAPGSIWTNLVGYLSDDVRERLRTELPAEYRTPEQGAAPSVFVASSPLLDGIVGRYFEDCNQAVPYLSGQSASASPTMPSTPKLPRRLWALSAPTVS